MPRKNNVVRPTAKVMESLSNAVSLFQMPSLNMLATDNNIALPLQSVDANARSNGRPAPNRGTSRLVKPTSGTIMCPW
jgi:hypothetical protein